MKLGALIFVLGFDKQIAINLQLLGGIWILQTFPALVVGLFTRWFHRWALLAGWAVAMVYGTWTAYDVSAPGGQKHFAASIAKFPFTGTTVYIAISAFVINMLIVVVLTALLKAARVA